MVRLLGQAHRLRAIPQGGFFIRGEKSCQLHKALGVVRIEAQCGAKMFDRLLRFVLGEEGFCHREMRLRVRGPQADRLREVGRRLVELSLSGQCQTEIEVHQGHGRAELKGTLVMHDGLVGAAHRREQVAKVVVHLRLGRSDA